MYLKKSISVIVFILFMTQLGVKSTIVEDVPEQPVKEVADLNQENLANPVEDPARKSIENPPDIVDELIIEQENPVKSEVEPVKESLDNQEPAEQLIAGPEHINKSVKQDVDERNDPLALNNSVENPSKHFENGLFPKRSSVQGDIGSNGVPIKHPSKLGAGSGDEDPEQKINPIPQFNSQQIISFAIYVVLAISGVYVSIFGFRVFRLLMIILGFYVSYYGILFILTEMKVYKYDDIGHQIGLFFGCIILGFIISIMCYMLDKINFVIFGMAIASVIALFSAQFFIDFREQNDRIIFAGIYLISAVLSSAMAFFILDHFIIWGSALVGAIITPINIGVIFGDFKSFERREKMAADRWRDFQVYLAICGGMFIVGLCAQYYLRRRIIKRMQDSNLEEIRGTSFLN
jgi:hypothetical protein